MVGMLGFAAVFAGVRLFRIGLGSWWLTKDFFELDGIEVNVARLGRFLREWWVLNNINI